MGVAEGLSPCSAVHRKPTKEITCITYLSYIPIYVPCSVHIQVKVILTLPVAFLTVEYVTGHHPSGVLLLIVFLQYS